ncbi:MAG: glycosyl transferase [Chloroflexi bacterium RBG_16_64_32]|nr:MAG: glycosyl transferase [Chloroflexi bacterium RBG_16_64_32]
MTEGIAVLGVRISPVNPGQVQEVVDVHITHHRGTYLCVAAVHSIMACRRDPALRKVLNRSGATTPDGMPLVWLCRLAGFRHVERVYGPDLMLALCEHGVGRDYRHFFFGGGPAVPEALAERLADRIPGLRVVGTISPPFGEIADSEEEGFVEQINAANPDIVWVGLGTGTQEHWMARNRPRLKAPVLIGVGAAFDFLSGRKRQAPPWMRRSGLEWLFRLATEPRRLWPRYREYPLFLLLLAGQFTGLRKYPVDRG